MQLIRKLLCGDFFSLNNSSGGYRACTSMVVNMTHV